MPVVGALAVVVLALAACSDSAEPGDTIPAVTSDGATTTAPTTSAPQPDDADATTSSTTSTTTPATTTPVSPVLEAVADGFERPVWVGARPSDGQLLVAEQTGRLRFLDTQEVLLDLSDQVSRGGEQGLLGIAFLGDRMFVNYTDRSGTTVVSEFDAMSPATESVLITMAQPAGNHNGGGLEIGPDGRLWVGTGDGGRANDAFGHGQDSGSLLGAMLRYDVSEPGVAAPAGGYPDGDPAVWAIGLRNPWRYTFDGDALIIADVGQNQWEEVSVVDSTSAGLNFGWPILEGSDCFESCDSEGTVLPAIEYNHSEGCSITGGVVYRGQELSSLVGHYLYADYCSGWVRAAELIGSGDGFDLVGDLELFVGVGNVTSFGTDLNGEIYVTVHGGSVFRLNGA